MTIQDNVKTHKGPKTQFFIVFSPEGPIPVTVVHSTHPAAVWAASRMAEKHPGRKFFVMGSVSKPFEAHEELIDAA